LSDKNGTFPSFPTTGVLAQPDEKSPRGFKSGSPDAHRISNTRLTTSLNVIRSDAKRYASDTPDVDHHHQHHSKISAYGTVFLSLFVWNGCLASEHFWLFYWTLERNEHPCESMDAFCKDGTRPINSRSNQELMEGTIPAFWEGFFKPRTLLRHLECRFDSRAGLRGGAPGSPLYLLLLASPDGGYGVGMTALLHAPMALVLVTNWMCHRRLAIPISIEFGTGSYSINMTCSLPLSWMQTQ